MTSEKLREKFLEFFKEKDHKILASVSLIPENDPTILFITAGMQPFIPYLMGKAHPEGKKLASVQKCLRTVDIEEVGDRIHHTFFEMCGNWSLGDYFKEESIKMSWEFLISEKYLNLDKAKIAVSVFEGDEDAPFDKQAYDIWNNDIGIKEQRIAKLGKEDNWWESGGETGPVGPDTEIFYWTGEEETPEEFDPENNNWVEIWNNVFMEYYKNQGGKYEKLEQKNIDTGMGFERILRVINGLKDPYETDLFLPVIKKIENFSDKEYQDNIKAMRVIADHIRSAVLVMGDRNGVEPSNTDQGYIVRRLIRRAMRFGKILNIKEQYYLKQLAEPIIDKYGEAYPKIEQRQSFIYENLDKEEDKFNKTLEKGIKKIEELGDTVSTERGIELEGKNHTNAEKGTEKDTISGKEGFDLFQTYGYPVEMTKEVAQEQNKVLSENFDQEFNEAYKKHQELSRTASAGKFKGGLADASPETKKLHTAAHLLLAALRKVLGDHVEQKGSNITPERLRFDFSHSQKMTEEEKQEVEKLVNEAIEKQLSVNCEEMALKEAKEKGAMGVFESKYGERVKVYKVGEADKAFSYEICGGPHVENTGELGKFRIKKEESSSGGVRRIKAVLE